MPSNVKPYDGSDDPEDHLKIFQATTKFDDLHPGSVDSYDDLKKAFLANLLQQKKCIKDPVEIHHIKQREGESTKDFVQRFKTKSRHVKGALEYMRIFGFMHGITNPELIKRLHDKIPKSVDEMMRVPQRSSRDRWQLPTRCGRKHFRHGSNMKLRENKILTEGEILEINKDPSGDVTSSHSS
ncbi:reverse transcriptase domain-containing protein [Tanacetum coccineum]|uniref:Reverse transcriptase domain-containing protein n=1 Tax=Tanacetum coccineum TaxID=301880 RepID=A0ABQ5EGW3_9ASTR